MWSSHKLNRCMEKTILFLNTWKEIVKKKIEDDTFTTDI